MEWLFTVTSSATVNQLFDFSDFVLKSNGPLFLYQIVPLLLVWQRSIRNYEPSRCRDTAPYHPLFLHLPLKRRPVTSFVIQKRRWHCPSDIAPLMASLSLHHYFISKGPFMTPLQFYIHSLLITHSLFYII